MYIIYYYIMYNERVLGGSSGCSSTSSVGAVVFDEVGAPYPNFWRLRRWLSPIVIPTAPQGLDHEEETITWICLDSKKSGLTNGTIQNHLQQIRDPNMMI